MRRRGSFLVVAVLVLSGCGRIREVKGCRALARTVNPVLDDIAARVAKDPGPLPYRHAATSYAKLAKDLERFDIGIPRTEKSIDDLGQTLRNAGTHTQKLAEALERRDAVVAATERRELSQLARIQRSIVARIDDDCVGD